MAMKMVGREFMSAYSWSGKASANFAMAGVTMQKPRLKKYRVMTAARSVLPMPSEHAPMSGTSVELLRGDLVDRLGDGVVHAGDD